LLNLDGEVVGINSWILSSSGGYIGLSFSIPIEIAVNTVQQLREHGKVSRGLLGVVVGAVTRELAEAMNLERSAGALVNDVSPGSAADKAGIKPGDVILAFDGQTIETWGDLPPLVGANPPGMKADVLVSRNGKERTFTVTLDALETDKDGELLPAGGSESQSNALGIAVESITADMRRSLGNPQGGVLISDVESDAAYRAGLQRGDVILMINDKAVADVEEFDGIVNDLPKGKAVALRVLRDGTSSFIAYTPSDKE
jgi:serine protease Do